MWLCTYGYFIHFVGWHYSAECEANVVHRTASSKVFQASGFVMFVVYLGQHRDCGRGVLVFVIVL